MDQLGFTRLGNKKGYPLAIIHGWGCDSSFLRPLADMFKDRDVYLIDLPGYGRSAHLAPLANDFSATNYFLINTIPYAADVISWSFGTLYALQVISSLNTPCLNLSTLGESLGNNESVRQARAQQNEAMYKACNQDEVAESEFDNDSFNPHAGQRSIGHFKRVERARSQHRPITGVLGEQEQTSASAPAQAHVRPYPHLHICMSKRRSPQEITLPSDATAAATTAEAIANSDTDMKRSLLECKLCYQHKNPYIRSLVTICGSPRFPSDPNWQGMSAIKILKCNTELTPPRLDKIMRLFYRMMASSTSSEKEAAYIKDVIAHHHQVPHEVLMAGIKLVTYIDERPALQHLNVPSLHLFGAHDPLVPCTTANFFKTEPLHCTYVFAYSAHNPYLSEPVLFEKVVRDFYEKLSHMDYSAIEHSHLKQSQGPSNLRTPLSLGDILPEYAI